MPLLVAIDLGTHAVKATSWRTSGRRATLEERFSQPVPQDGALPSLEARLAALDALVDENPAWASSATVGLVLPSSRVSFRPMELPFGDRAQVEKTLPFAIEAEVPYDLDDVVLGWRSHKIGAASRVMAVLARKADMAEVLDPLKERGMNPRSVVADGELYADYSGGEFDTVAVVDIGHTHTVVSVVKEGTVRASRAISVGGHGFTAAIQTALECSWTEAEARKHGQLTDSDPDAPTSSQGPATSGYANLKGPARQAMDGAIGQLLAEIRSTLIRFEDMYELDVEAVKLCGGSARIPELTAYLEADLGIPVSPVCDPDDGSVIRPAFAAVDAMSRTLAGQADFKPVELRVDDFVFKGSGSLIRTLLINGTIGGVFFAVAVTGIFIFQYASLISERSEVNERIADVVLETFPEVSREQVGTRDQAEAIMVSFTTDTVRMSELLPPANPEKPVKTDLMYQFINALPPHEEVPVDLTALDLMNKVITFEGETDGFAQSAQIEETLGASKSFSRATKDTESRTNQGKVKFKFSIPLGPDEKKEG